MDQRQQVLGALGSAAAIFVVLAIRRRPDRRREIMAAAKAAGEPRDISRRVLPGPTKWLKMAVVDYATGAGEHYQWEYVERPTLPPSAVADGVECLALAHSAQEDAEVCLVVVLQYRPAVGKRVVELPAGLMDEADAGVPAATARRELLEETGYHAGELLGRSTPALHTAPWLRYLRPVLSPSSTCSRLTPLLVPPSLLYVLSIIHARAAHGAVAQHGELRHGDAGGRPGRRAQRAPRAAAGGAGGDGGGAGAALAAAGALRRLGAGGAQRLAACMVPRHGHGPGGHGEERGQLRVRQSACGAGRAGAGWRCDPPLFRRLERTKIGGSVSWSW